MKNKLIVDFFREIAKGFGRFISIFFIVMLGTAFFAGLRSSGSDMRISADRYYDDTALMDFKVLSTLGLTDDDLADVRKIKGVESVTGAHTKDVVLSAKKAEAVLKLIGITKEVNKPYITEGRLPNKSDECLVDTEISWFSDYKIGDKITVSSDDLAICLIILKEAGEQALWEMALLTHFYLYLMRTSSRIYTRRPM